LISCNSRFIHHFLITGSSQPYVFLISYVIFFVRLVIWKVTLYIIQTDRYNFFETETNIFKFFLPMFGQLPMFYWPPIPIF